MLAAIVPTISLETLCRYAHFPVTPWFVVVAFYYLLEVLVTVAEVIRTDITENLRSRHYTLVELPCKRDR